MFSFRYLVTSLELHKLFEAVNDETYERIQRYQNIFYSIFFMCMIIGPLQFNDFDKLMGPKGV
jgi:hypothetical protein